MAWLKAIDDTTLSIHYLGTIANRLWLPKHVGDCPPFFSYMVPEPE